MAEYYIQKLSENVSRKHVSYRNRYGITLAGDLYTAKDFENAKEPKKLYVVDDAEHIDLYDRTDRIPFDKLEKFFKEVM